MMTDTTRTQALGEMMGDDEKLCLNIEAYLKLEERGAISVDSIGSFSRELLSKALAVLRRPSPAPDETSGERVPDERLREILDGCEGVASFDDGNLMRYEHGGGRLAILPVPGDGERKLIADFYNEADREHFTRLDPGTVRSLVSELLSLRSRPTFAAGIERAALRKVAVEAYWLLAWTWQSHVFRAGPALDMTAFAPEAREMMNRAEQDLFDALSQLPAAIRHLKGGE